MLCGLSSCFSDTEQGSPGSFRSTLLLRNVSAKCGDRWQPFGTLVGADGRHWVWVAGGWVQGQLSVHGKGDSPVECRFLRVAGQSILETIGDDARVPFPWHLKLQCLDIVAVFLHGVPSAVCTRQPPTTSVLAHYRLPAWSSVHAWWLRLRTGSDFAPARLPSPDPVLHGSAPVRKGAVADARLGLA